MPKLNRLNNLFEDKTTSPEEWHSFLKANPKTRHNFYKITGYSAVNTERTTVKEKKRLIDAFAAKLKKSKKSKFKKGANDVTIKVINTSGRYRDYLSRSADAVTKTKDFMQTRPFMSVVNKSTQTLRSVGGDFIAKWKKFPKWGKASILVPGSIIAYNVIANKFSRGVRRDKRAIPEYYERGYDIIKDMNTDFGSPVNLSQTSRKVISQYHSSTRSGKVSTVNSKTKNLSLHLNNNAINHHRY